MTRQTDKTPSMPLFGKDLYTDERTTLLSWAHHGLYIRLMWWQWSEGSIPDDLKVIVAVVGKEAETRKLWRDVGKFFIPHPDHPGRLINKRLEDHRRKLIEDRQRKQKGGHAAHIQSRNSTGIPPEFQAQKVTKSPLEFQPLRANANANAKEPGGAGGFDVAAEFEALFARHPNPGGKVLAMHSFAATVRTPAELESIKRAHAFYLKHLAKTEQASQSAGRWFSGDEWPGWDRGETVPPEPDDFTWNQPQSDVDEILRRAKEGVPRG